MPYYISNGRLAWELPPDVGWRFHSGVYLTPPGWDLIALKRGKLPRKSWRQHQNGYYVYRELQEVADAQP